jgi:hypothetical protein
MSFSVVSWCFAMVPLLCNRARGLVQLHLWWLLFDWLLRVVDRTQISLLRNHRGESTLFIVSLMR